MTAPTVTLAEWLLARIAEDEAAVRAVDALSWSELHYMAPGYTLDKALAECEAKRRIVEEHPEFGGGCSVCHSYDNPDPNDPSFYAQDWPCLTLRLLALPYASHPGYDEAWRP